MSNYVIQHTQPSIIIDRGGRPTNGFLVRILMTDFNEIRELEVATDEPQTIHEAAMTAIAKRKELEKLANGK